MTSHVTYWPDTAIKQYSTGRSNVLGLSDSGLVWEWKNETAVLIAPLNVDLKEKTVFEVQAGIDLVPGGRQESLQTGLRVTVDTVTIPGTSFRQHDQATYAKDSLEAYIGEVKQFIVLESHIVFTTHHGRVFSYTTTYPLPEFSRPNPVELTTLYNASTKSNAQAFEPRSLVGSFRNFGIVTSTANVLTATDSYLNVFHEQAALPSVEQRLSQPDVLPSLQSGDVVSVSFGDYHMHALHSDGTISSLGTESQRCGALGLGDSTVSGCRGVQIAGWHRSGSLNIPQDPRDKRTVWFEPLMESWIGTLVSNTRSRLGGTATLDLAYAPQDSEQLSTWFEREGRKWMRRPVSQGRLSDRKSRPTTLRKTTTSTDEQDDEDDLPAYFALKVASAGWHSAALVLVDDDKAQAIRDRYIEPRPPATSSTVGSGIWNLGRRFLGLTVRDENEQSQTRYIWENEELPRTLTS
ncbi:uncharacterized protein KY384_007910 [Bacidia gigantensis]|uniref:uncharacterized protein n=1 Tax=Bacidia gigantensis TaxID=2732470 RepID=UPI001D03D9C0|nr:uncharacterized protein KY384_007910 [Bacidia gigantensis]KAG8527756.1 hypothetical protein KY384_007910 [Bacidia gigantensis]